MEGYTPINEAVDRINRAISALDADINEWSMIKAAMFGKKPPPDKNAPNTPQNELRSEFDTFLDRSRKVKDNLTVFHGLFSNVSVN